MFIDYREPDVPANVRSDICIVGAGAAGITLALALADSGLDVCVIESGGYDFAPEVQSLYEGESVGMENASPTGCRLRFLGGTTNHWQGWCAPLQDIDFAIRPWVPHSGWPLTRRDLDPYYGRARSMCQIGAAGGEAQRVPPPPAFDSAKVIERFWHFSPPTRFGQVYRKQLASAARVSVYLHCNVYQIQTNASASHVRGLKVRTLAGKTGTVSANSFVLACGGMENTRLLLLTDDVESTGLGNRSGTLGRYFTQHVEGVAARIVSSDAGALADAFVQHDGDEAPLRAHLAIAPEAQRKRGLLNTGFSISASGDFSTGYQALRGLWHDIESAHWPDDLSQSVWSVMADLDGAAGDLYRRSRNEVAYLNLDVKSEQAPNAASTISLSDRRDVFGLRQIRVNWQLSAVDKQSMHTATLMIAEELGRLNLGRLQLADWLTRAQPAWPDHIWGGCHHMGTTRMSHGPAEGIVNTDGRIHTVENLYIAGSSVFPTGGYVPPTLTIVALALRLADHLKVRYG